MPKRSLESAGDDGFKVPDKVYKGLLNGTIPVTLKKLAASGRKCLRQRRESPKRAIAMNISAPGCQPSSKEPSAELRAAVVAFREALIAEGVKEMQAPGEHSWGEPAYLFLHVFPGEDLYFSYDGLDTVAPILAGLYMAAAQQRGSAKDLPWKPFT